MRASHLFFSTEPTVCISIQKEAEEADSWTGEQEPAE